MWNYLLSSRNGVFFFHNREYTASHDLTLWMDASSTTGFGAYYKHLEEFIVGTWVEHPLPVSDHSISFMELYLIVLAANLCGHSWGRRRVAFVNDN